MVDLEKIIEELSSLNVMEAAELAKKLEEKWGVSASAPMAMMAAPMAGPSEKVEEKTQFDVILVESGANKINVIKEVKAILDLGLKEAKDLVDGAPKTIKSGIKKEEADEIEKRLKAAGAKVEIK